MQRIMIVSDSHRKHGNLAEAIYNFVMEIGIFAAPKSLSSPGGPVTGVINMVDFKIS